MLLQVTVIAVVVAILLLGDPSNFGGEGKLASDSSTDCFGDKISMKTNNVFT